MLLFTKVSTNAISKILFLSIFMLISFSSLKADPFIEICNLNVECQYVEAGPQVNGCSGSDIVLYAVNPQDNTCSGTVSYQWYTYDFYNTGNGWDYGWIMVLGATENRYEVNNHSTFPYRCEVTCDGNTYTTNEVEVSYNSTPPSILSHPENIEICEGVEVFFEGLGTGSQIVYQWETKLQGGQWLSLDGENESFLGFLPAVADNGRSFRLKISNNCAYTVTASATLTVNPNPQPDLGPDVTICEGNSHSINVVGNYASYLWNTNDESNSLIVSEPGIYSVTVTTDKSCTGIDDIQLFVDSSLPEFNLGEDIIACSGELVNLEVPSSYDSYLWNNGSDQQNISVSESGQYWVRVSAENSVCKYTDTIFVELTEPWNKDNICIVTTDPVSGNNLIIWERTPNVGIASYNIYRQSTVLNIYNWIGNLSSEELSVFEDLDADPEVRQWVYKITAIDTCGNESDIAKSKYHIPLFLQYVSSDNGVNLSWVAYAVQNGDINFVSYIIYRGSDSTRLESIGEISSDLRVYRDTDPKALSDKYYYRVAGVRANACVPAGSTKAGSGPFIHSLSNLEDNRLSPSTAINEINNPGQIKVFPNPFSETLFIELTTPEDFDLIRLMDLSGKVVYENSDISGKTISIPRASFQKGVYILEVQGKEFYRERIVLN